MKFKRWRAICASTSLLWPWPTNQRLGLSALRLQRPHQVRACCSSRNSRWATLCSIIDEVACRMGDNSKTFCGGLLKELTASVQCPWPYQSGAPSYVEWEGGTSLLRRPKYFLIPLYRISTRPSPSSPSSNTNHQPLTDSYSPSRTNLPERQSPRQTPFSRSPNFVSSLDLHTTLPFRRSPRFAASPKVCAIESGRRRLSPKSTPALNYISTGCPIPRFPSGPATLRATTIVPPHLRPIPSLPLPHL